MFSPFLRQNPASRKVYSRNKAFQPRLEALEDRSLLSVIRLGFDSLPSAQGWMYTSGSRPESAIFSVDGTRLRMNSMGTGFRPTPAFHFYEYNNAVDPNLPFTISAT